jgi:hypothetical protein
MPRRRFLLESIADGRGVRASEIERPERRGARRLYLIEEASDQKDQEAPDVRITEEHRQLVRNLVAELESALPGEVLMHLGGGVEAAAWRKRALEASA